MMARCDAFKASLQLPSRTVVPSQISFSLLTLPGSVPQPQALISYLSESDMCSYRLVLNNCPSPLYFLD